MTTGWVKPNGDSNCTWELPPLTDHYLEVDEYPNNHDFLVVAVTEAFGGNDDPEIFEMTTLDDLEDNSITQIVVYTYGVIIGSNTPEIDVSFDNGANWEGEQECTLGLGAGEVTNTWSGLSFSKADLDLLLVKYVSDVPDKNDAHSIDRIYAVITYTEAVVGYGHDFMGVPDANIGSVSGVPTENIDKIKGV